MKKKEKVQKLVDQFFDYRLKGHYRKEIKNRLATKNLPLLTKKEKNEVVQLFSDLGVSNLSTDWHRYYSGLHKKYSVNYVPEDLFYTKIEPALNDRTKFPTLADKNLLSKLFPQIAQPKTIVKNLNGNFLSNKDEIISFETAANLIAEKSRFIIKPSIDSGGGKNVLLVSDQSNELPYKEHIEKVLSKYNKDFIVQEVLTQHPMLKKLNPTSINTIRVMSYLEDGKAKVLSTYIRMGRKGAFADNISKGGLFCGVDNNGKLHNKGYNLDFDEFKDNGDGLEFDSIVIPFYDDIKTKVCELHQTLPYFRLISWDISVDSLDSITLIELNLIYQEINAHQVINGPVLFDCFKSTL